MKDKKNQKNQKNQKKKKKNSKKLSSHYKGRKEQRKLTVK